MDSPPPPLPTPAPRLATAADAAELTRMRAQLFAEMGTAPGDDGWRAACVAHLRRALADGTVIGAVVDGPEPAGLVAAGLVDLRPVTPGPANPGGREAYLYSMYTQAGWRRRGLARAVLERLLGEVRRRGIAVVELHATADGEALYASAGFRPRPGGRPMRLSAGPGGAYPARGGDASPPSPLWRSPGAGK